MKKIFYLFPIFIIFLCINCTTGGTEWALIGSWQSYKTTGEMWDDYKETIVISSNDRAIIYTKFYESQNSTDRIIRAEGYVQSDYQAKTLTFYDYYYFRVFENGVKLSEEDAKPYKKNYEVTVNYTLTDNNNTLIIFEDDSDYEIYFSKMQ